MYSMTAAEHEPPHPTVGMRELSQRTAKVLAMVRAGETVDVTDRGNVVAHIVPAVADRYAQLAAAGVIRQAQRPFDLAQLPEPVANTTDRSTEEWLADLRGEH
jgi:antitoxin (DNA-binding transcriptional repressor) of toxin-antitoxin stability system